MTHANRILAGLVCAACLSTVLPSTAFGAEVLWRHRFPMGDADSSVLYADVTSDPGMELVFTTTSGRVNVTDIDGEILWTFSTREVLSNAPTAADLFPGGRLEILAESRKGVVVCLSSAGEELWRYRFPAGLDWNQTVLVAADLDADGAVEVVGGDSEGNFVCLDRFGEKVWSATIPGGLHCPPAVADLDSDGLLEIVVTSESGKLLALSDRGEVEWESELGSENISGPVLADLDGDGDYEIVVGSKEPFLHCYSHKGEPVWKASLGTEQIDSTISIGNLTGDAAPEILCMDLEGFLYCFDSNGAEIWKKNMGSRSRRAPSIADFNNDGKIEILVSGYFGRFALLSAEGEEIDSHKAANTNGGATVIDYHGRLAAVLPYDGGNMVCLTWQDKPSEELPEVQWGSYRVTPSQTGALPVTAQTAEQPSPDPPKKRARDFKNELLELDIMASELAGLSRKVAKKRGTLGSLRELNYRLGDHVRVLEELASQGARQSEEEATLAARKTQLLVAEAKAVRSSAKRILERVGDEPWPRVLVWSTNPWRSIRKVDSESMETLAAKSREVSLYKNEAEAIAVNILSLNGEPMSVRVKYPKNLAGPEGPSVTPFEVVTVPTETEDTSDDALPRMNQASTLHLAPEETRQVFLSLEAKGTPPGNYEGELVIEPVTLQSEPVAFTLQANVLELDIFEGRAPFVCTWGYVYNSFLKEFPEETWEDRLSHGNNVMNITAHYLPRVVFDASGELTEEPDFGRLGEYVAGHESEVFLLYGTPGFSGPDGVERFSEVYTKAYGHWVRKLVAYLKSIGIGYDRFAHYPVDEPGLHPGLVDLYIDYAKMTRAADPRVLMYTDPVAGADLEDIQRMADYVDVWCPNRYGLLLEEDEPRIDVMLGNNVMMWTYECLHSAKMRPPLEYYRGLAWLAQLRGIEGFGFWSYCTSADDPWLFPVKRSHDYLLVYPGEGPVSSRRWESVRDGSEDIRALNLLRAEIEKAGEGPEVERAKKTIEDAIAELGRFGLRGKGNGGFELEGKNWANGDRVDREWEAYDRWRHEIAEATLALRSLK